MVESLSRDILCGDNGFKNKSRKASTRSVGPSVLIFFLDALQTREHLVLVRIRSRIFTNKSTLVISPVVTGAW